MRDFNKAFEKSEFSNRTDFILGLMNNSKVYIFKYNLDILRNIQINLAQIGNNLNQIVRRIQTTDTMYKEDLDEINSGYINLINLIDKDSSIEIEEKNTVTDIKSDKQMTNYIILGMIIATIVIICMMFVLKLR